MRTLKKMVEDFDYEIDETSDEEELEHIGQSIVILGKQIIDHVTGLRNTSSIFNKTFVFKSNVILLMNLILLQDYVSFIKKECSEVRNLLYAYDIELNEDNEATGNDINNDF